MTEEALLRREFNAMGTDISLFCPRAPGAWQRLELAARWISAYEDRLSRFIPYSELSRMNNSAGKPFQASPLLFAFVRKCLSLAERSGGVFDPSLLHEIESAGYDRTFDLISATSAIGHPKRPAAGSWREISLDVRTRTITLPEGLGIDSGGLGKGFAADRIARFLGPDCCVDCGGDIAARGRPPDADAWYIGVQDPFTPDQDVGLLAVRDRGVATSSTLKRRWPTSAGYAHHLIDARTGGPSDSDVVAVSVVAEDATMADYHAKVSLLKGSVEGLRHLEAGSAVEGLMTLRDGSRLATAGMARYLVQS